MDIYNPYKLDERSPLLMPELVAVILSVAGVSLVTALLGLIRWLV